jgi:hypothetical protein
MKATVKYASGREYGIGSSSGVSVVVRRDDNNALVVYLTFSGARTTGDLSWQAGHFGNEAACDEAKLNLEPEVAARLGQALLAVAAQAGAKSSDTFAASVDVKYQKVEGHYKRVTKVKVTEKTPLPANPAEP